MENENNELMVREETGVQMSTKGAAAYCSIDMETADMATKKAVFNALNKCDILINDIVGKTIKIKDFIVQPFSQVDEKTGEIKDKYRTIIFDDDGKTYVTTAYGIRNVLDKILRVFGDPATWGETLEVKVVKQKNKDGKETLTFELL